MSVPAIDNVKYLIRNSDPVPLQVAFDLQGDALFLVPGLQYTLIVPTEAGRDQDVELQWLSGSLVVGGNSDVGVMKLVRENGDIVWADSQVWGDPPIPNPLDAEEIRRAAAALVVRLDADGLSIDDLALSALHGRETVLAWQLIEQGLLTVDGGRVVPTPKGRALYLRANAAGIQTR